MAASVPAEASRSNGAHQAPRAAAPSAASVAPAAASPAQITLPKVQAYDLPLQDLDQVAQSSGLQWVNSDAAKIAEAQAAIASEVKPAHVPRERPALAVADEGPLVLVETRRDLGAMTMPFEKQGL
jgi:ribonuclease E